MIRYLSQLLIILLSSAALGQNLNTEGFVTDKTNGNPIQGAELMIEGSELGCISDINGEFALKANVRFPIKISVSHLGYSKFTLSLTSNPTEKIHIELTPATIMLGQAEILDSNCFPQSFSRREKMNAREIQRISKNDIGDILRTLPNVDGIRKGGQGIDPVIRGFKFNQLNIQANSGQKIEGGCPNRMDPTAAHFDVGDLEQITVIKGPFSLKYGPSIGGVVNLITNKARPMPENNFLLNASKSWQSNWEGSKDHLDFSLGNEHIFMTASGNYQKYGDYKSGDGRIVDAALEKYNAAASVGAQISKGHIIRVSSDYSYGRNIDFASLPMDERTDNTKMYAMDYEGQGFGDHFGASKFKIYYSDVEHIMDNKNRPFSDTVVAISSIDAINKGGRFEQIFRMFSQKFILGADLEIIDKDGERTKTKILDPGLPTKYETLWANAKTQNAGIFAGWENQFGAISLRTMLRIDFNSADSDPMLVKNMNGGIIWENANTSSDFTNLSFSVGMRYQLSEHFNTELSFGRGVRSPDMTERFITLLPVGYDNYDYLGNPELKPEYNYETDLSFNYNHPQTGQINISAFYSYVGNYITGIILPPTQIKPQTKGVLGVKQFYNADHAYLTGFEASYATPLSFKPGLLFTLGHTVGINPKAHSWVKNEDGTYEEKDIINDPLPEIPPLKIKLDISWPLLNNTLEPVFSIRMAAEQTRVSKAYEESPSEGYIVTDFRINYTYNEHFSLNAGIKNILDKNYYEHLNRKLIDASGPLYEPGRMFFINLNFSI